jgi:transposase-like protein
MSNKRYTEEFKIEAVKQVTEHGYSVSSVARRLGVTTHSLYTWRKKYGNGSEQAAQKNDQQTEITQQEEGDEENEDDKTAEASAAEG